MTQELTSNPPPDDFDAIDRDELGNDDDALVAAMLSEAYDAPPVPSTLAQRLDDGIAEQWGASPGLAPRRRGVVALAGSTRQSIVRVWPLVAGLAAVILFAVFLTGGSGNYAWATVVDAIRQQGLIQIQQSDSTRWLDLSKQVAGEQNRQHVRWIDLKKRTVVTRVGHSIQSRSLPPATATGSQDESLLAAFLCGESISVDTVERFRGVRVLKQNWDRREKHDEQFVDLRVQLKTEADKRYSLALHLNPKSGLPVAVGSTTSKEQIPVANVAIEYPNESTEAFRVARLESEPESRTTDRTDTADRERSDADGNDQGRSEADPALTPGDAVAPSQPSAQVSQNVASLPIGAAKQWLPVQVVSRSDADVSFAVDASLEKLWADNDVQPVRTATDLQLLRRAYLDLAGRIPTVTEVRSFLNAPEEDRYERLVDQLLDSPDHASQLAAVWRSFLIPEGVDLDAFGGRQAFEKWLAGRFAAGEPYDQIVQKLLLADGRLSQSGPLLFYSALKLDAHQLAARTSRVFLGMRLECAQCHDHPFESWTQKDFWSFAAFFARISRPKGELESVSTVMRVQDINRGEVMLPETDIVVAPRFLGEPNTPAESDPDGGASARRDRLASWLTDPQNPYFARATVNRVWSQLLGRGIVDPVDDFGENNPPVSPELLDVLASQFIDSGFDLKTLIRTIALSKAYRLSSGSEGQSTSEDDAEQRLELFAQMNVKTLTAEQLYDCIAVATLLDQNNGGGMEDYTLQRFGNTQREAFLQQFSTPAASRSEYLSGIPQALMLMNGSLTNGATGEQSSGLIRSLQAPFFTDRQRIDVLFMATLSRPASPEEADLLAEFAPADASPEQRTAAMSDLLWALINSSEFTFNH
ncbi:DUF1553 domain-containing protein [Roseiconus nitratireducens]|uniref:DUF1553 domain-containing protein n=1 Tax=Roseiconus nitratireducens TaxID=2605748 RepID=A0A5M6D1K7_9BACT|nr:DUF1549 and DUF1553 domain-containing protein [Roseiconus nitratireducens]KAA5538985.1 DUF1553 domain-containing protein [Roseiconus nitratireducens]